MTPSPGSARDVTAAAVAALVLDLTGRAFQLSGPAALTFDALAAELGAGLDRDIAFRRITPEEYADLMRPIIGPPAAAGVAAVYGAMPEGPNPLMAVDADEAWATLGVRPTTARDWAAQVLAPRLAAAAQVA